VTAGRCTIVAGASGVIGLAAVRHLASRPDHDVIAVSRRAPLDIGRAAHRPLDLADSTACDEFARAHQVATHLVYTAVREAPGLVPGWSDRVLMRTNLDMFVNLLDALVRHAPRLSHVTLLQGTKAYGVHVDRDVAIPCRESALRHPHENFYFLQEDALRDRTASRDIGWTILRPQIVFGEALGSNMNPVAAIGVYGALLAARGEPLHYPGGGRHVSEGVDADLLAKVIAWAGDARQARDEIFNVANGDVFVWRDMWPAIADVLGMEMGEDRPTSLAAHLTSYAAEWAGVVARHHLAAPMNVADMVGQSAIYADMLLAGARSTTALPQLVSTIKLRQAGFGDCVDTEQMMCRLLRRLQERHLLPLR
jgi:nucleoside-diphosphate-sugar epimerase